MASRLRNPSIPRPRVRCGKALFMAAAFVALALFFAAVIKRSLRAGPAGAPSLPWKEARPAEIFGAGP
jgi:hypothetical protein